MILDFLRIIPKSFLGVDIGTSSIKIVELSRWGERKTLHNYGELKASALYNKPFRTFEKNTLVLSSEDIARAIRAMLQEAGIQTKKAVFSLPDFSSFFTNFQLPPMTKEELPQAVEYEARKHIPLPIGEVTFDWQVTEGKFHANKPFQILLVAVPNEIILQYQTIAQLSQIELFALEAEVFGLVRSSVEGDKKRIVVLLDIGAQTTTISVISDRVLKMSHSIDMAGNGLTERIATSFSADYKTAEENKMARGMDLSLNNVQILSPLIDTIITEVERTSQNFAQGEEKQIEQVILGGGSALLPGLKKYFEKNLKYSIEIANPFHSMFYPPILDDTLKTLGPSYAIAVGMAMRGFE